MTVNLDVRSLTANSKLRYAIGVANTIMECVVADAGLFPTSYPYYIVLAPDDTERQEIVLVTDLSTQAFTVTRGALGTTACAHPAGEKISLLAGYQADEASLILGSSGVPIALLTDPLLALYATTAYASTSAVRVAEIDLVQTVNNLGNSVEVLKVNFATEKSTGDWCNAIVARLDYGTAGDANGGMAAPLCSELNLPGKTQGGGAYYVLDLELNCPENFVAAANHINGLINLAIWGDATAIASWEDEGYVMRFDGFTADTGNVIGANTAGKTTLDFENWVPIRIRIGADDYYLVAAKGITATAG